MKFRIVFLISIAWLLAVPVSTMAKTRVEINHTKNFRLYKTFAVEVEPPIRADGTVDEHNTIVLNSQRQAVAYQLRMRGLSETDVDPDLIVRVSSRETEIVAYWGYPYGWYGPWGYGGYWGSGYWYGPGYGYWGGGVWPYTYSRADVKFDVFERSSGDLVYRGQVWKDVDEDDLSDKAMKFARKAFKKFPIEPFDDD